MRNLVKNPVVFGQEDARVRQELESYIDAIEHPTTFVKKVMGKSFWAKQDEVADAIYRHPRVVVRSGNGTGKAFAVLI